MQPKAIVESILSISLSYEQIWKVLRACFKKQMGKFLVNERSKYNSGDHS